MRRWPTGRARNGNEMGGLEHKAVAAGFQPAHPLQVRLVAGPQRFHTSGGFFNGLLAMRTESG
jgi:hypothetical protein